MKEEKLFNEYKTTPPFKLSITIAFCGVMTHAWKPNHPEIDQSLSMARSLQNEPQWLVYFLEYLNLLPEHKKVDLEDATNYYSFDLLQ